MSDIKKQLTSGVFYTAIAKYTGVVVSIIIGCVLARLLTPEEFGTIIPITVLVAFFAILGDVGIGPAVIQNNDLSRENIDSIFSFTIFTGLGLAILFFCSSWMIASIYDSEIFVALCQVLSLTLFFSCANVVPNALLFKAKKFKFLAVRTFTVQATAGVAAIVAAYLGAGIYALVVQSVIASVFMFVISYRENPLKLHFFDIDWAPLKTIRNYSSYQLLFNILNYFAVNLDKLLLNKYMGATQLGYYDKSYKLMQMPMQTIPFVITPVMHPIFSTMQNDLVNMRMYYSKVVRFLSFIGFPLSIFLYFAGAEIIFIMFGAQWAQSVPVFKILALSVGFQMVLSTSGSIFQAAGSTKMLFLCGLLSTAVIVVAILTGLFVFYSLEVISLFLLIAFIINFFTCFVIMYCVLFKSGFMPFLKQIISPLVLSMVLAVVLCLISQFTAPLNMILSFCIKGFVAAVVFFIYIQFSGEYNLFMKMKEYAAKLQRK